MTNAEKPDIKLFDLDLSDKFLDRFWSRVDRSGECWEWIGSLNNMGYGQVRVPDTGTFTAHRLSYLIHRGPYNKGLRILHSCDNRKCINPKHLRLGTQSENIKECFNKGRGVNNRGEKCGTAKLTGDEVRAIRKDSRMLKEIAQDYGVAVSKISRIRNRKSWSWLD